MYKIKRFSVHGYSSVAYVGQRQFGLLGGIRKFKSNLANKVRTKANKYANLTNSRYANEISPVEIKDLNVKLAKDAYNKNSRILRYNNFPESSNFVKFTKDSDYNKLIDQLKSKGEVEIPKILENSKKSKDSIIFHKENSGTEFIAHELGHIDNSRSKGIGRKIHELDKSDKFDLKESDSNITKLGKSIAKSGIKLIEESNASRNAMKSLKRLGMKDSDLKRSKKNLDAAYKTYVGGAVRDIGNALGDLIQGTKNKGS